MKINTKTYKLKDINSSLAKTLADQYNLKEDEIEFVRKGIAFDTKSSVDKDAETSTMYVSTKYTDRDGDIVVPSGVILDDYRKTPVVLWCHDYHAKDVPVGKNLWIKVDSTGLLAKTKYHTRPGTMGEKVYNYLKDGFPLACSIGFAVLEGKSKDEFDTLDFKALGIDPKEARKASNIFTRTLLMEYSMVPVASNQNSVVLETKSFDLKEDDKEFIYIIDPSQEIPNGEQEIQLEEKAQETEDSGTSSSTQEKEVEESFIEFTDIKSEDNFCTCTDSEYDNDTCKACGGKRKPKKEAKAPQCQCSECDATCAPEDGKCDMNCPKCGASMSMSDDNDEDDIEQDACKPKKPKKDISELGYTISDDEIESLVNQFEKMLDEPQDIYFEFDVDVNKKYLFEDCVLKNIKLSEDSNNKTKEFDIANAPSIASSKTMDLMCKFLECRVKNVYQNDFMIPWVLSGAYLAAFKEITSKFTYKDTRNYTRYGEEVPPSYEVININSKTSDDFLVEGIDYFSVNGKPVACKFTQTDYGIFTSIFTSRKNKDLNKEIIASAHKWVEEKNPLKGEKLSLNREFFDVDTKDNWDTVILDTNIEKTLKHSQKLIENKEFNGRGILMLGPPGTGKTKSARVLMSQTKATYIWVSSKDLTNTWWPEKKIALGFELARKLAPSILLLEDIDNWIEHKTIDMMKTELDGLQKNKNVITILTTNNPEKLPNTLIDRPGRFHDVLNFDHPNKSTRERMLKEWLDIENEDLITQTEGFSGAYMWELIEFAKSIAEDEEITIEEALVQSLEKINSQKELIRNIKKENKNFEINLNPVELNGNVESFIELIDNEISDKIKNNSSQINKSINTTDDQQEDEFDFNKALSIVEKSLDKVINTKYIDVDDLVYESLMKAKGKMFY